MSYLAEESGFISHSAFATTFKNITGMPPSEFIRISKNSTKSL
ncbi:AraC family transcriptional regulator [Chryseobacterium arthrosphaerae]|nr:AraC family transcriptional regulator [Chryseobacterium arthrosphaerae]MDG4654360.1 AraC family transcriptional regulator [Chryseobacterium arthrosphaerae]